MQTNLGFEGPADHEQGEMATHTTRVARVCELLVGVTCPDHCVNHVPAHHSHGRPAPRALHAHGQCLVEQINLKKKKPIHLAAKYGNIEVSLPC